MFGIFCFIFILIILSQFVFIKTSRHFFRRLSEFSKEEYWKIKKGRPYTAIMIDREEVSYFLHARYRVHGDEELNKCGNVLRVLCVLYITYAILFVTMFLITLFEFALIS